MSRIAEPSSQGSQGPQQSASPTRSKLVQRLLDASANLPTFLNDLLTTQAVVVAGTEAAAFLVERQEQNVALRPVAHIRPDDSDAETRAAAVRAFQNIVQPCVAQAKDGAIEVGSPDGGDAQYCLVTVLRNEGEVVGASAVITRARDMERAKQRLTSMQLVAGYFELYSLRRFVEQSRALAERHQHVLQYAGAVATAEGFHSSAVNLCNELATRTGATRVSLGWVKGRQIKVRALSHTEKFDKKQELVVELQKVMEECLDQEEPVRYDPDGNCSPNVTRAARDLSQRQGGNIVLSAPLRHREEIVGVITLEFPPRANVDAQVEAGVAVTTELLSPQLYDRYHNDRNIFVKIGLSVYNLGKVTIGPKYMGWKLLVLFVVGLILFMSGLFYKPMHRVRSSVVLTAVDKRTVGAPMDGIIDKVHVRKGQRVEKGQVLAEMKTTELVTRKITAEEQARAKAVLAEKARNERKIADQLAAEHERDEALAQAALYQYYIDQAKLTAPISGVLVVGDLTEHVGAPVKQGDKIFEIAQADERDPERIAVEAELQVTERDIQRVARVAGLNRDVDGELATTSVPSQGTPFKITRIVPEGEPKEGENVFRVYATVIKPEKWMHPGLAGQARIDIEPRSLAWIWTHRLTDWLKLKTWSLLPSGF